MMTVEDAALLLWLQDYPGDSARMFRFLTDAERNDYEMRARTLIERARQADRRAIVDAQAFAEGGMVRVRLTQSAAVHFVQEMRSIGYETVEYDGYVGFMREGSPDARFSLRKGEAEQHLYIWPDAQVVIGLDPGAPDPVRGKGNGPDARPE